VGARISTARKRVTSGEAGSSGPAPIRSLRRIGAESSKTRALLLDAAEQLMLQEGYAAVTSRKVASEANVTGQLVHYYFSTMDELFLALWRRFVTANTQRQAQALTSPHALGALWDFSCHATGTALELEFIALAHHRKAIRREIARDGDRFRSMQIQALSRVMGEYGLEADKGFAEVLTVLLTSVSRSMIMEKDLGVSVGHARTFAYIEQWIERLSVVQRERLATQRRRKPDAS
jgi:TetR/AcrR family transcriptional regulator